MSWVERSGEGVLREKREGSEKRKKGVEERTEVEETKTEVDGLERGGRTSQVKKRWM